MGLRELLIVAAIVLVGVVLAGTFEELEGLRTRLAQRTEMVSDLRRSLDRVTERFQTATARLEFARTRINALSIDLLRADACDADLPLPQVGLTDSIAFASDRDGDFEIYVMSTDGSNVRQLTHNSVDDLSPDWSPDGSQIVFQRSARGSSSDLFVMDVSEGSSYLLERGGEEPAWSPNGKWIAFNGAGYDGSDVTVIRPDRRESRSIANQVENNFNRYPTWAPNSRHIAFHESDTGATHVGRLCCSKPGTDTRFLAGGGIHPAWSPDGKNLLIGTLTADDDPDNYDLYIEKACGSGARPLVAEPHDQFPGSWSPDGRSVVFYSDEDGSFDIYAMDVSSEHLVRLTQHDSDDIDPDWGP